MKYDNESLDGRVGFIEKYHKYVLKENKDLKFNSVTTLLKDFAEEFDPLPMAEKVSKSTAKKNAKYFGRSPQEIVDEWLAFGKLKAAEGTELHLYGERLLNGIEDAPVPDLPKARWVPEIVQHIKAQGYEVARTELLVYSEELQLAGQSDIILKKKIMDEEFYMIFDWKFLSKPIQIKSFYNPRTHTYKKMRGIFKHLMDCNWIHYSIQLAIYQTLTGAPSSIKEKVLVIVYDDKFEFVPTYPMRVFWDENLNLQAVYEIWTGEFYDSRINKLVSTWPADIKGR